MREWNVCAFTHFFFNTYVFQKAIVKNISGNIYLPHEKTLSERSSKMNAITNESDEEKMDGSLSLHSVELKTEKESAGRDEFQANNLSHKYETKKSNIELSFREWRSTHHGIDDSVSVDSSIYNPRSCAICMAKYEHNDDICWSKNEKCYHAFHLNCVIPWLMKHNECPMCRRHFLKSHDDVENVPRINTTNQSDTF